MDMANIILPASIENDRVFFPNGNPNIFEHWKFVVGHLHYEIRLVGRFEYTVENGSRNNGHQKTYYIKSHQC